MLNLPQIAFSALMGLTTGGMSTTAKLGDVSRMLAQQSEVLSPEVARMIPFGATAGSGYAREASLRALTIYSRFFMVYSAAWARWLPKCR